jgi:hypothetical protein
MTASQSASVWVHRKLFNRDAGIVDEHADRTKGCFRAVDRFCDRGQVSHVHLHRDGAATLPSYLFFEAFQLGGLACRQHDRGAMRRQDPRELPAQPLRGAGDENDFFTDVEYVRHGWFGSPK